jgi:hypothetical protein
MSESTADHPPKGENLGGVNRPYGPVWERYVLKRMKNEE